MTDVAVGRLAHAPHVRRTEGTTNGVEMLMPCFASLYAELGLTQTDIGFLVLRILRITLPAGRSRSSRQSTRSAPCRPSTSHVEMDAAWALYEAYIKLLTGEVFDRPWSTDSANPVPASCAVSWRCRPTPIPWRRCGRTRVSMAGPWARARLDAGTWTAEWMAGGAGLVRRRRSAPDRVEVTDSVEDLRPCGRYFADPLRRRDIAPSPTGRRSCWPATGPRTAGTAGLDHRFRTPHRDA